MQALHRSQAQETACSAVQSPKAVLQEQAFELEGDKML